MLKDYLENGKLNIDKMLNDFYGYVYIIVKNGVSSYITDEDVEVPDINSLGYEIENKEYSLEALEQNNS